ncbi:aryl carrier-like protein, partial [Janthinobacterium sp. CG_23.3]|uniref:acyl carrier protein n=1 Tax=Janthinobacterium sp. CG_23.3 TaxID=3349634 RepID=UPI0038D35AF2
WVGGGGGGWGGGGGGGTGGGGGGFPPPLSLAPAPAPAACAAPAAACAPPLAAGADARLAAGAVARFKKLISDTLRVPLHKIDAGAQLAQYGIDSILIVQLTNALRQVFADVGSTLFFECLTIDALVAHFIEHDLWLL